MTTPSLSHRKAAQRHALKRARERFDAGPELIKALRRVFKQRHNRVAVVRDGRKIIETDPNYVHLGAYPDGRVEAIITLEGVRYRAIYNTRLKAIVTVIPTKQPIEKEVISNERQTDGESRAEKTGRTLQASEAQITIDQKRTAAESSKTPSAGRFFVA